MSERQSEGIQKGLVWWLFQHMSDICFRARQSEERAPPTALMFPIARCEESGSSGSKRAGGAPVSYSAASTPCSDGASSATAIDRCVARLLGARLLAAPLLHFDFESPSRQPFA